MANILKDIQFLAKIESLSVFMTMVTKNVGASSFNLSN